MSYIILHHSHQIDYDAAMRIFMTGATGFIGQHLAHKLTAKGHEIVALVRNPNKAKVLPNRNIQILKGDLFSFKNPDFVIPECDQVIHLAGTVTAQKISDYHTINYEAIVDLYNCLLRQSWLPKRLHFCSSQAASGPCTNGNPVKESDPPHPVDAYGVSKLKAEEFLLGQNKFPVTINRPCTVIGPLDENVYNLFKIAKKGFGFVKSGENQKISFISVEDVISAMNCFLDDTSQEHKTYFISHSTPTDTQTIWREVGRSMHKEIKLIKLPLPVLYMVMKTNTFLAQVFRYKNAFDKKYYEQIKAKNWVCSSEALQRDFGWKPKKNLKQALKETAESYKKQGLI